MSLNTFSPQSTFPKPNGLQKLSKNSSVIVVGAGAFGGWTALSLLRGGLKVKLIDAWGAGNSRSSSGDETRVIRSTYGSNEFYFDMNVRALQLWKENEKHWNKKFFYNSGVLWFCYEETTPVVDDSIDFAKKHRMEYEYVSVAEMNRRYPLVNTRDLHHCWFDPFGGYLKARESCQAVKDAFVREGGDFIQAHVKPGQIKSGTMQHITLSDGTLLHADAYLFACGSWLGQLFPEVLENVITCSKQEAYYFGVPENQGTEYDSMPVWVDVDGKDFYYGIPGNSRRAGQHQS